MSMEVPVSSAAGILARMERLTAWPLPRRLFLVIGLGYLFTFYDIFDVNVSFVQTATSIIPGATPANASRYIGLPIFANLLGYVVGTLVLSPLADRLGRRRMLMTTMFITGVGSLLTALATRDWWFVLARGITGVGVAADLAVVNTYMSEIAPRSARAKYTSGLFIFSGVGALIGIWLGLWLTTPSAPFPEGLPFALATPSFHWGWRLMYAIGAVLALIAILLRLELPESPRWLAAKGRVEEAAAVVAAMEERLGLDSVPLRDGPASCSPVSDPRMPYGELLGSSRYRRRVFLLFFVWLFSYVTVYGFSAGMTTLLVGAGYAPSEAGLIVAVGVFGMVLAGVVAYLAGEVLERKTYLLVAAVLTIAGGLVVGLAGHHLGWSYFGAVLLFFGQNVWVPVFYAWTAENFPSRARTSGFALVDGAGHIGAGVGLWAIAPFIPSLGVTAGFVAMSGFLLVAALIALGGIASRGKVLEEISP
ncbi:MFS transporter [Alicyclobacillus sendaiensis]|uniref:MFS transporter n=1 Tax=Alicyclobacillus sendaiensis PA2 TaxID=3029425 RepID=A0ABT6XZJ4_ALISE|nr:MFS transporter [Alicyclobacillus sendaiensis]MDI9260222.1 MFS transporter [Alicyclobacillus sendaiensis PA2]